MSKSKKKMKSMSQERFIKSAKSSCKKLQWVKGYTAHQKAKNYQVHRYLRTTNKRRKKC